MHCKGPSHSRLHCALTLRTIVVAGPALLVGAEVIAAMQIPVEKGPSCERNCAEASHAFSRVQGAAIAAGMRRMLDVRSYDPPTIASGHQEFPHYTDVAPVGLPVVKDAVSLQVSTLRVQECFLI